MTDVAQWLSNLARVQFTVHAAAAPTTLQVTPPTDITASADINYIPIVAGVSNPPNAIGTVTYAPGQVQKSVTVWVKAGTIPVLAGVKTFAVSLSDPAHPGVALATDIGAIIPPMPKPAAGGICFIDVGECG